MCVCFLMKHYLDTLYESSWKGLTGNLRCTVWKSNVIYSQQVTEQVRVRRERGKHEKEVRKREWSGLREGRGRKRG